MVSFNEGYPDSENLNDSLHANNDIIVITDTDTDDEENPYNGYEPLPLNDFLEGSNSEEDTETDDTNNNASPIEEPLPAITRIEDNLLRDIWSAPTPNAVDIEMDSSKVDEVKQVMLNITLPTSSIPEWANNIPEDQWKQQLISRLQSMQKQ